MTATLYYVFDPLCGWCWGASAAVAAAAEAPEVVLHLLPSGLFGGEGARPMDHDFATYAWGHDQRIARLTGQPFTERYRQGVLADRRQEFDSGPATVALTAVALSEPQRERAALNAIQHARYVDGQDITRLDLLATVLRQAGLEAAAARLAHPDAALLEANRARMAQARALLREVGAQGVPTFILEADGRRRQVPAATAYTDPQAFVAQFTAA